MTWHRRVLAVVGVWIGWLELRWRVVACAVSNGEIDILGSDQPCGGASCSNWRLKAGEPRLIESDRVRQRVELCVGNQFSTWRRVKLQTVNFLPLFDRSGNEEIDGGAGFSIRSLEAWKLKFSGLWHSTVCGGTCTTRLGLPLVRDAAWRLQWWWLLWFLECNPSAGFIAR